jgi:single-strand DNA-binding protein
MFSKFIAVGRLVRDPELRSLPNGTSVGNFTLAIDRPYTNKDGEKNTDFIRIVVWRKLAESANQNLSKGRLVLVEGHLEINEYEKDGVKYRNPEVSANVVKYLDWPNNGNNNNNNVRQNNNSVPSPDNHEDNYDMDVPF